MTIINFTCCSIWKFNNKNTIGGPKSLFAPFYRKRQILFLLPMTYQLNCDIIIPVYTII